VFGQPLDVVLGCALGNQHDSKLWQPPIPVIHPEQCITLLKSIGDTKAQGPMSLHQGHSICLCGDGPNKALEGSATHSNSENRTTQMLRK